MREKPDVVSTTWGTRPGDNLAEVLLYFLFARVLRKVTGILRERGMKVELDWSPDMRDSILPVTGPTAVCGLPTDVCWMDDLCFMGVSASAADLLPALETATGVLIDGMG